VAGTAVELTTVCRSMRCCGQGGTSTSEERGTHQATGGGGTAYRVAVRCDARWRQLIGANPAVNGDLPCLGPANDIGVLRGEVVMHLALAGRAQ
jgi:hypothetical protein